MRGVNGKIARRALRRHRRKSEDVWEMVVPVTVQDLGGRAEPKITHQRVRIRPVEYNLSETEAQYHGLVDRTGLRKLIVPGDLEITEDTKLYRNGVTVNIKKVPEVFDAGSVDHRVLIVQVRVEDSDEGS